MQYNMDDPRARLMQKWSSNLPSYDSTYLREGGDEQNGVGVDSQFLGINIKPNHPYYNYRVTDEYEKKIGKKQKKNKKQGKEESKMARRLIELFHKESSSKKTKTPMDEKRATEILQKSQETVPHFVLKMLSKAQSLESGGNTQMNDLKNFLVAGIQTVLNEHKGYSKFGSFANSLQTLRESEVKWRSIIRQINPNFSYTANYVAPPPDPSSFNGQRFFLNILTLLKKPIYIACKYVNAKAYQNAELKKNPFVKKVRHMFRDVRKQIRKYISAYKLTGVSVPPKRERTQPGSSRPLPFMAPPPPAAGYKPPRPASSGYGRSQMPGAG